MSVGAGANALAESTKIVGAGLILYGMEFWMIAKLEIFKGLDSFFVKYRRACLARRASE